MTLIERLEKAESGSRELDAEIACHIDGRRFQAIDRADRVIFNVDGVGWPVWRSLKEIPHYTTSLDAALTLVPEGLWFSVGCENDFTPVATVYAQNEQFDAFASSPALALCIAALKARSTP
jgi:hypothetical protein